jgi:hypothetical protein
MIDVVSEAFNQAGNEVLTLCSGIIELSLGAIDQIFGVGKLLTDIGILVVEFPVLVTIKVLASSRYQEKDYVPLRGLCLS